MLNIAFTMVILASVSAAISSADSLEAIEIAALIASQIESTESVHLEGRYSVKITTQEEGVDDREEWFMIYEGEVAFQRNGMWRVDGMQYTSESGSVERPDSQRQLIVHDGDRTYLVNQQRDGGVVRTQYADLASAYLLGIGGGEGLQHLLREDFVIEGVEDDEDGRPRIVVQIPAGHSMVHESNLGLRLTITTNPDAGYMPIRIEYYDIFLGMVTEQVLLDGHICKGDIWFPTSIVRETWEPVIPHPGSEEYEELVETVKRFGVDMEQDRMKDGEWVPYSRDELLAARRGFQAYFGAGGVPRDSQSASKMEVTRLLGLNDDVPDSLFAVPFAEGALVYIDTDARYYRYRDGKYTPAPTPSDEGKE